MCCSSARNRIHHWLNAGLHHVHRTLSVTGVTRQWAGPEACLLYNRMICLVLRWNPSLIDSEIRYLEVKPSTKAFLILLSKTDAENVQIHPSILKGSRVVVALEPVPAVRCITTSASDFALVKTE